MSKLRAMVLVYIPELTHSVWQCLMEELHAIRVAAVCGLKAE